MGSTRLQTALRTLPCLGVQSNLQATFLLFQQLVDLLDQHHQLFRILLNGGLRAKPHLSFSMFPHKLVRPFGSWHLFLGILG